ncbi:MAG: SurA N-terminal domain-containing protein [Spirochaetales bacterium]|nr:SurA N-terminal domain-containing protein [Spirochaetales bacterium]
MKKRSALLLLVITLTVSLFSQEKLARVRISDEEVDAEWNRYLLLETGRGTEHSEEEAAALKEDIRKGIIMRKLLISLAAYRDITVSQDEVDQAVNRARGEYPEEEWVALLKQQLFTPESFRRTMEESLIVDRVLKREVRDKIVIEDREIEEYYHAHESIYTAEYGLLPLREVRGLIRETLTAEKNREETARFMDNLYSRSLFVEENPTPTQ